MNRPYGNGRLKFLGNYQITLHSGLLFKFPQTVDGSSSSFLLALGMANHPTRAIQIGEEYYQIVFLNFSIEHLFMCLLIVNLFSLETCLFKDFTQVIIGLFVS